MSSLLHWLARATAPGAGDGWKADGVSASEADAAADVQALELPGSDAVTVVLHELRQSASSLAALQKALKATRVVLMEVSAESSAVKSVAINGCVFYARKRAAGA